MACILKLPTKNGKGVLTFTDRERDWFISKDKTLQEKILSLKDKWVIGMHHNWTTFASETNHVFDFAMYLESYTGNLPLIPLAAINFAPACFTPAQNEKFWDILYIARAVKFKSIPEFFKIIRNVYDLGKKYRVLLICPIPPYKWKERKSTARNIREVYDAMFTEEEKDLFTLLTTTYRDPIPFDDETLSYFYKSSRIFVHSSHKERQGRVTGNAWASGMPLVGLACTGTPLPRQLQIKPYFYEAKNYEDFTDLIDEAIAASKNNDTNWSPVTNLFRETESVKRLRAELKKFFASKNIPYEESGEAFKHLARRLARHHGKESVMDIRMPLSQFIDTIIQYPEKVKNAAETGEDPEKALMTMFPEARAKSVIEKLFRLR